MRSSTFGTSGGVKRIYERDGYAVVPRVFSLKECAVLANALDSLETLSSMKNADIVHVVSLSASQLAGQSRQAAGKAAFIIGNLSSYDAQFRSAIADRRVTELVTHVLAGKVGGIRITYHYSNLTAKPPRIGPRINWHRDFPNRYMSMRRSRFCRAMICLDGMNAFNGPTTFQARSHLLSDVKARKKSRKTQFRTKVALCPPGSIVLIHPKVRHGGGPNRSPIPRRNIIVQYGVAYEGLTGTGREQWTGLSPQMLKKVSTE